MNKMLLGAVLFVYKGDWGQPSIDFECLKALCLVKFTRCPIHIDIHANPLRSGGKLPYLQIGTKKFIGYRNIKKLLDREGYPIDVHLEGKSKQLSPAYGNWVFTSLHAYYHYYMYGDPNNFDKTRALYAKRTPFPFNFYYPMTYQKEARDVVLIMGGFDIYDKVTNHEDEHLLLKAKQCVNLLSKKLAQQVWFFGDIFSEFDAIAYAYLAIILHIPLPNNPLQNHVRGCKNLVTFVSRISKDIFKHEAFCSKNVHNKSSTSSEDLMLTPTERGFLESEKKTKLLAGIGAMVAMITFAAWRGLYTQFSGSIYHDDEDIDDDDMD